MRRIWILLLMASPSVGGCAMCCSDDDYNYAAYGGSWERADMAHGRVGSAFEPAGYGTLESPHDLPLEEIPEPAAPQAPDETDELDSAEDQDAEPAP